MFYIVFSDVALMTTTNHGMQKVNIMAHLPVYAHVFMNSAAKSTNFNACCFLQQQKTLLFYRLGNTPGVNSSK